MCAEAVWWRCHRRIIADYLLAQGVPVIHIMGSGKVDPAKLTSGAHVLTNGTHIRPHKGYNFQTLHSHGSLMYYK